MGGLHSTPEASAANPQKEDEGTPCHIEPLNCLGSIGFQSVCWAAAASSVSLGLPGRSGGLKSWHTKVASAEREACERLVIPRDVNPA